MIYSGEREGGGGDRGGRRFFNLYVITKKKSNAFWPLFFFPPQTKGGRSGGIEKSTSFFIQRRDGGSRTCRTPREFWATMSMAKEALEASGAVFAEDAAKTTKPDSDEAFLFAFSLVLLLPRRVAEHLSFLGGRARPLTPAVKERRSREDDIIMCSRARVCLCVRRLSIGIQAKTGVSARS